MEFKKKIKMFHKKIKKGKTPQSGSINSHTEREGFDSFTRGSSSTPLENYRVLAEYRSYRLVALHDAEDHSRLISCCLCMGGAHLHLPPPPPF